MANPFKQKIKISLANQGLQAALDDNAIRRRAARLAAYESLPEDPQILRQRAHAVRQDVIQHLDTYLEQFVNNAQSNGFTIHRAVDASEAVHTALKIISDNGGKRVVKSKTMVGEELDINAALEAAGCQVTETDLGEWIVQLRGEKPSHLLTPAVHLNRIDVAQLFTDCFGCAYTEDVPELTAFARKTLRSAFLEADVGISGVNFGVASEGSICLVTNEGNGRMATTLPRVHIALMGCERLVRDLDDLALILSLLPRASSGQKISVYTSLIRSPRQPGEIDGAQQRHIILIDNGRTALRNSPLKEALYCIRCGSCLNACPVFREIGGHAYVGSSGKPTPYSGPIGSVISPGLFDFKEYSNLAQASSLCGACQDACPVDIALPDLLLRVRAGTMPENGLTGPTHSPTGISRGLNWGLRAFGWLAAHPTRFRAVQRAAGRLTRIFFPRSTWVRLPAFSGWGASRDLPKPALRSFQDSWQPDSQTLPDIFTPRASFHEGKITTQAAITDPVPGLLKKFQQELELIGGRFELCEQDKFSDRLAQILSENESESLLAWDEQELPPGIVSALVEKGFKITHTPDPSIRVGLTGALAAVAETGTLVLDGRRGRPQAPSLLPEIHLAVITREQIYENLSQVFALRAARECTNLVLVSGPSRTADIEMTLTIGVHGPSQVVVLCVDEGDST